MRTKTKLSVPVMRDNIEKAIVEIEGAIADLRKTLPHQHVGSAGPREIWNAANHIARANADLKNNADALLDRLVYGKE